MKRSFNKMYQIIKTCGLALLLSGLNQIGVSQSCDFTTGSVSLTVTGGNQTDVYSTEYVLTSFDGTIVSVNQSVPDFEIANQGFYSVYAINFKDGTDIDGLDIGANIDLVTGSNRDGDACFEIGAPFSFTVCEEIMVCNFCLGETVSFDDSGGSTDPDFTNQFVLTDNHGIIISIVDAPVWSDLGVGSYLGFAVNYETALGVEGLDTSLNIANIESSTINISEPFVIGICDDLNPTIFFDLKGCDITETAILQVGETFDSYLWSTGETASFIEVSATEVATYRVTVSLIDGCIGIQQQPITGNEISRLGDFVWEDSNADGLQNANEDGINGVRVNLYSDFDKNGVPDFGDFPSCTTTTRNNPQTGDPGWYEFTAYQANYVIEVVAPTGFVPTEQLEDQEESNSDINDDGFTGTIAVVQGATIDNLDAGFRTSTGVGGLVWVDDDGDGRREGEEQGIDGITINLYTAQGELVATTVSLTDPVTEESGVYLFEDLPVRDYYVEFVLPDGRAISEANVGTDESRDSDVTGANGFGTTDVITTSAGEISNGLGFGIYTGGIACGIVWREVTPGTENIYDEGGDEVIGDSQVELINSSTDAVVLIGVTGDDGRYCIDGIPIGSYRVKFRANNAGESYVQPNQGNDPLLDSDIDMVSGTTGAFFVAPQDSILGINGGLRLDALPIELVSFTGTWDPANNLTTLVWVTASEINNDHFDIERVSENNGVFEVIGQIAGGGTRTEVAEYNYVDNGISSSGTYYYRLKQVDYDGGFEYSSIVAIDVILNDQPGLSVFPNPIQEKTQLDLMVVKQDLATITLMDLTGKELTNSTTHKIYSGHNLIDIDCSTLPNGSYLVSVIIGSEKQYELIQVAR